MNKTKRRNKNTPSSESPCASDVSLPKFVAFQGVKPVDKMVFAPTNSLRPSKTAPANYPAVCFFGGLASCPAFKRDIGIYPYKRKKPSPYTSKDPLSSVDIFGTTDRFSVVVLRIPFWSKGSKTHGNRKRCCGWKKSISHHFQAMEQTSETVGSHRGIESETSRLLKGGFRNGHRPCAEFGRPTG